MKKLIYLLISGLLAACSVAPDNARKVQDLPAMFPDYSGVEVPVDIAPLNFGVEGAARVYVEAAGAREGSIVASGSYADFDIDDWHQLTRQNAGDSIFFCVSAEIQGQWIEYKPFGVLVSADSLSEWGVTYRRIKPGYETFSNIGIFQRNIHNFDEFAIVDHTALQGECMNCHVANRCDAGQFQLHIRGQHSATLVQQNGNRTLLNTATDSTIANCMYAYWHPSGRYIAYSLNLVNQCFFEDTTRYIEVFDLASDALILDLQTNQLVLSDILMTKDFESYPAFSADGNCIYYCTSKPWMDQGLLDSMRYDLCRISFDPATGRVGDKADTIIHASRMGKSVTHPRPSYDGRYLLYSVANSAVFPIHHREADLWVMDLQTMESYPLDGANSDHAESFHNWSTNSRWIVFTSKRHNDANNLIYISHFGANGKASKAFLLPQRDPVSYYADLIHSYNVVDFTTRKVELDVRGFADEIYSGGRIQVGVRR